MVPAHVAIQAEWEGEMRAATIIVCTIIGSAAARATAWAKKYAGANGTAKGARPMRAAASVEV